MTTLLTDLRRVMELLEEAGPGPCDANRHVINPHEDDAAAIAAAVNFIREHGQTLERMAEDARRYRWLRENEAPQTDAFMNHCYEELDAAIDQQLAQGEG